MTLYNDTLLRAYLSHLQSLVRRTAALRFERDTHPDALKPLPPNKELMEEWQKLNQQLVAVLGVEAELVPFGRLAEAGTFHTQPVAGRDPFRITFRALKMKADKHRRKDPSMTLLQSWDVNTRERPPEE